MAGTTCKSNEMCLIYFLFLTTVNAVEIETRIWENVHNNNGWTPISRDNVYNSFDEKFFPKMDGKRTLDQTTNELIHSHRVFPDSEFQSKFIQPRYMVFDNKLISSGISPNFLPDSKGNEDAMNMVKTNGINNRKPKAISGNGVDVVNIITEPEKLIVQKDSNNVTERVIIKQVNQYQVTEKQEQKEDFEKISNDVRKPLNNEPSSNHYDIVKGTVADNTYSNSNEFTKKFHDILSSYNIRVNDVLPNYDLSRHSSRKPSTREYIMVPIPIRLANRFNSMNHLPFDPLLAVFLSNFGYYLPGHYGVNNKYYNLYGYLASNNIHNNEPFGSYKIFADTDSSS